MKLVKEEEKFYVVCHTDDCGYNSEDTYVFPSMDEVEKFFGIKNDYENHIYYNGTDIYGQKRSLGCNEFPVIIYSRTDYEINWECEESES